MKKRNILFMLGLIFLNLNIVNASTTVSYWKLSNGYYTCYTSSDSVCPDGFATYTIGDYTYTYYIENGTFVQSDFRENRYFGSDGKMITSATNYNIGTSYYSFASDGSYEITSTSSGSTDISSLIQTVETSSSDLSTNNYKTLLSTYYTAGNSFTLGQREMLNTYLSKKVANASSSTTADGSRAAVVAAARFLALDFKYGIDYYLDEIGTDDGYQTYYYQTNDTSHSGSSTIFNPTSTYINLFNYNFSSNMGVYNQKGLFLNDYNGWGTRVSYRYYNPNYNGGYCSTCLSSSSAYWTVGSRTYKDYNGLDCSGFVTWTIVNGGVDYQGIRYYDYLNYLKSDMAGASYKITTTDNSSNVISYINNGTIKAGDLVWKTDHVGIIIGIDTTNKKLYVAEATTYSYVLGSSLTSTQHRNGDDDSAWRLRVTTINYEESSSALYSRFTTIIQMGNIYTGDGNYTALWTDEEEVSLTQETATITLTAKTATYTGEPITANTATTNSDGTITYTYYDGTNCSGTALSGAPTNAGSYSVYAKVTETNNYTEASTCVTHTITKKTGTITLTAKTAEYTGEPITANTTTTNSGGTVTYSYYNGSSCSGDALSSAPTEVGDYSVKATVAATTNYTSATSSCVTHTITEVGESKTIATITLEAKTATYTGEPIAANTATTNSDGTVSYTYYSGDSCSGTALSGAPTDAGTYSVIASIPATSNFTAASTSCTAHTISKKTATITLTAKTAEYTGSSIAANTAVANSSGTITYTYYSDTSCSSGETQTAPTSVGNYSVKATVAATTNYTSATSSCVTHTITSANTSQTTSSTTTSSITSTTTSETTSSTTSQTTQTTSAVTYYTITFDLNGGHFINGDTSRTIVISSNDTLLKPSTNPLMFNSKFLGWYLDDTEYDFSTSITQNLTLTAKYEYLEETTTVYSCQEGEYDYTLGTCIIMDEDTSGTSIFTYQELTCTNQVNTVSSTYACSGDICNVTKPDDYELKEEWISANTCKVGSSCEAYGTKTCDIEKNSYYYKYKEADVLQISESDIEEYYNSMKESITNPTTSDLPIILILSIATVSLIVAIYSNQKREIID